MTRLQKTVLIRERGQLTIPDIIRKSLAWVAAGSAVTITSTKADELVIKPHTTKNEVDWKKLWKDIKRVRSFNGKHKGSLSEFIVKDRESGHSV